MLGLFQINISLLETKIGDQAFFTDNEDRLYVMTYEKDSETDDYIFDIFTSDGFFVGRTSIKARCQNSEVTAKMKGDRLYSVNEKGSGFKELIVYKMEWE